MLLLGTKTFHVLTIRAWNERLNHLIKQVIKMCHLVDMWYSSHTLLLQLSKIIFLRNLFNLHQNLMKINISALI
jgi:hypothetical protein